MFPRNQKKSTPLSWKLSNEGKLANPYNTEDSVLFSTLNNDAFFKSLYYERPHKLLENEKKKKKKPNNNDVLDWAH